MTHIREGRGPCLIEFSTYRFKEHCGPHIDPYQPEEEVCFWQERDPLRHVDQNRDEIAQEIDDAFVFAEKSAFPSPQEQGELYA